MRNPEWQRVSPAASIYFLLRSIPQLINLWPALLGIWATGDALRPLLFSVGIPLVLVLLLTNAFLQYWFFRFCIEDKAIAVRSGVIKRTRLSLDFARVQQADISRPFYFRPFNLVTLGLESAGSAQQEVDLPAINEGLAESLRTAFLEHHDTGRDQTQTAEYSAEASHKPNDYYLQLAPAEVARFGLMRNTLLFLAPFAAPLSQSLSQWFEAWLATAADSPALTSLPLVGFWGETGIIVLLVFAVIFVCVLAVLCLSIGLALFHYWGFEFVRRGDYLQSRAGLLTTHFRGFKLHKLQKLTVVQGPFAKLLRRHSLYLSKAGGFSADANQLSKRFVIPVVDSFVLRDILADIGTIPPNWRKVSAFYILLNTLLYGCLLITLAVAAGANAGIALFGLPLVAFFIYWRWHRLGYFHGGGWIAFRTGWFGYREQWLPTGKVQKIVVTEPPLLRFRQLANLRIWSTDGALTIPCLPNELAYELRDQLLTQVVNYRKAWF